MNPSRKQPNSVATTARDLLASESPLLDLRAPAEFALGAPANAINLPILTDAERHRIGITYKQQGQAAAVKLGHKLVAGATREQRISGWQTILARHPGAGLYCWRGGSRSQIASQWLAEAGTVITPVDGGYKALRQASLAVLDSFAQDTGWWVLGGRTGSGKTRVLQELNESLDLEGFAQHRGSAFGGKTQPQPTPVGFEFLLARAALRHPSKNVVVEDESRTIGRLATPTTWFEQMQQAPVVILQASLGERTANIVEEYVTEPLGAGHNKDQLQATYQASLGRIRKRLGGVRYQEIADLMRASFLNGTHNPWVEALLTSYYDPMYDYQLTKKRERILFEGNATEAITFLTKSLAKP